MKSLTTSAPVLVGLALVSRLGTPIYTSLGVTKGCVEFTVAAPSASHTISRRE